MVRLRVLWTSFLHLTTEGCLVLGKAFYECCERTRSLRSKFVAPRPALSLEHYGMSPALYERFLDKYMQYTCGLFVLTKLTTPLI